MKGNMEERAVLLARYIVENEATVRAAAGQFGVSKSTVHKDVSQRLRRQNPGLYREVRKGLARNKAGRPPAKNTPEPAPPGTNAGKTANCECFTKRMALHCSNSTE